MFCGMDVGWCALGERWRLKRDVGHTHGSAICAIDVCVCVCSCVWEMYTQTKGTRAALIATVMRVVGRPTQIQSLWRSLILKVPILMAPSGQTCNRLDDRLQRDANNSSAA